MKTYREIESPTKGANFWLAAPQEASHDTSISKEIYPNKRCNVNKQGSKLFTHVF